MLILNITFENYLKCLFCLYLDSFLPTNLGTYVVLGILLCLVLDASLIRYEGIRAGGKVRGKITGGERKQQPMHKI